MFNKTKWITSGVALLGAVMSTQDAGAQVFRTSNNVVCELINDANFGDFRNFPGIQQVYLANRAISRPGSRDLVGLLRGIYVNDQFTPRAELGSILPNLQFYDICNVRLEPFTQPIHQFSCNTGTGQGCTVEVENRYVRGRNRSFNGEPSFMVATVLQSGTGLRVLPARGGGLTARDFDLDNNGRTDARDATIFSVSFSSFGISRGVDNIYGAGTQARIDRVVQFSELDIDADGAVDRDDAILIRYYFNYGFVFNIGNVSTAVQNQRRNRLVQLNGILGIL